MFSKGGNTPDDEPEGGWKEVHVSMKENKTFYKYRNKQVLG